MNGKGTLVTLMDIQYNILQWLSPFVYFIFAVHLICY